MKNDFGKIFISNYSVTILPANLICYGSLPNYLLPKPGFKSITVSENVYRRFFDAYAKNKKELEFNGITSFSGYLTSMMEDIMKRYEAKGLHAPFMEKILVGHNSVIIKDNKRNRIVEITLRDNDLQCLLDDRNDCVHIGFVYSLPELYFMLTPKEIKTSTNL